MIQSVYHARKICINLVNYKKGFEDKITKKLIRLRVLSSNPAHNHAEFLRQREYRVLH